MFAGQDQLATANEVDDIVVMTPTMVLHHDMRGRVQLQTDSVK